MNTFFSRPISHLPFIHLRRPILGYFLSSYECFEHSFAWNSKMRDSYRRGDYLGVLSLYFQMSSDHGLKPNRTTYLLLLKASASLSLHQLGITIHGHIMKSGFQDEVFVATALVNLFSKLSDVNSACKLFEQMPERDVATWNAMLSGYSRNGYVDQALSLFYQMGSCGMKPNSLTLSILLQVCYELPDKRLGRCIHAYVCRHLELGDTFLYNSLLVYYNRYGDFYISKSVFEKLVGRDTVSWNAMMSGYTANGSGWKALEAFHLLREEGLRPDLVTLETALQACARIGEDAIKDGKLIHGLLVRVGFPVNVFTGNSLLLMYCKCGRVEFGQALFDNMKTRNLVSWNILVNGYIQIKCPKKAISLFKCAHFVESEVSPDLLVSALKAVKLMGGCRKQVMCIHCLIMVMGFDSDVYISSSLITAYGACGEIEIAVRCFDNGLPGGSSATVLWNALLSVYTHNGYFSEAVELLGYMKHNACIEDAFTLVNALSVFAQRLDLELGKAIHGYIVRKQLEPNVFVNTSLLELYVRCRSLNVACRLFSKMALKNIVSWNTMIYGCLQNGFPRTSLKLFHLMQQQDGLIPDATSVSGVVEAITRRGYESERNYIHEYAIQTGLTNDEFVANSLIAMHARFRDFGTASMVFDRATKLSTVTWNTMIAEYSHHGMLDNAIFVFHLMKVNNVAPDSVTLLCLLPACAHLGSLSCAMWSHTIICKAGYESDVFVATSLIDIYGKCGDLSMARSIFDKMNSRTTISWNSMIQVYGMHGNVEEVGKLFSEMQQSGLDPNTITFLILISASSHAGDIEKGQHYFDLMSRAYSLSPKLEHYSSFVDLLGRKGLVKEAIESLDKMPVNPGVSAWGALLSACRVHGNLEVGLVASEKLFDMDPLHCGYYALVSNMCADSGRWMDASMIRRKVEEMGIMKVKGWSRVET